MKDALLAARSLAVQVGTVTVCRGLELALAPGQCWALLGRNGAGKTTLLHTLAGLRPARAGDIRLDGRPLETLPRREAARRLGLLPQAFDDPFPGTVLEAALSGRHPHLGLWEWEDAEDVARARQALARVGLAGFEGRDVRTLSGGERRRLGLATVLVQDPAVLLLDEPASHLDPRHRHRVLELVGTLCREDGRTALVSLHEPELAWRHCTHALVLLGNGETAAGPREQVLTDEVLTRCYDYPVRRLEAGGEVWFREG